MEELAKHNAILGFTLIELMIVVVIIGILSSLAIPRFSQASRKAKYSQARLHLKRMYQALTVFYAENGCYPQDTYPNIGPPELVPNYLAEWPAPDRDPFGSIYDYEEWTIDDHSWIGVTYLGENLLHDGGVEAGSYYVENGKDGELLEYGDDLYIVVDVNGMPCQR